MKKRIHIVCLDAPAPPNYGGAIDMYYKIVALAELGYQIVLHYFDYRKERNVNGLEKYCAEIYSYTRKSFASSFSFSSPYIVRSRIHSLLLKRLNEDSSPIIAEGLHCSGILPFLNNSQRLILRMHNNEAEYYKGLAAIERNPFKKIYFNREAYALHKYQTRLNKQIPIAAISETDILSYKNYGFQNLHFIPSFTPWQKIAGMTGKGQYCLYHGNMTVSENEEQALWLITQVFSQLNIPFVIAGRGLSTKITAMANRYKNVHLVQNPPDDELNGLIRDAHINVLPSRNSTGVKLKLLHALFEGRFCITNTNGIKGSHIQSGLSIANEPETFIQLISQLFEKEFTPAYKEERLPIEALYNNKLNAQLLSALW